MTDDSFHFGTFELRPGQSVLLDAGKRVALGSRALAILTLLVRRPGDVVTASEITDYAWPGIFVAESNLRVQLTALRKALRDGQTAQRYIVNVPGRGYRFASQVTVVPSGALALQSPQTRKLSFPLPVVRLIGRDAAVDTLIGHIKCQRMVTLVGPGGIGKTSVAVSALARLVEETTDEDGRELCFVELSALVDPGRVANAVAFALHLPLSGEPLPAVLAALQGRRILIVLDNCEHVIMAAASLAEAVLQSCGEVQILATSREPLRCLSETIYRLSPLDVPPVGEGLSAQEVTSFSAVRLFVERAANSLIGFGVTPANAEIIAHVCRQLDGLPLALELAAACASTVGLEALVTGLDDRLDLLTQGRRTTARHETLRAMLDWSHDLLTVSQGAVLANLSVFRTAFTLEAAVMVAQVPGIPRGEVIQSVLHLAAKSLLQIDRMETGVTYRMLDTTLAYAAEKLVASTRRDQVRRQHAAYVRAALAQAEAEWKTRAWSDWWDRHGLLVEDIRAALDWAFSAEGDPRIGIDLTLSAAPIWLGRSQLGENCARVRQALDHVAASGLSGSPEEMRLRVSLGHLLFNTDGPGAGGSAAFERGLEIAEAIGDLPHQITALWVLSGSQAVLGNYPASMELTRRIVALAALKGDSETTALAERMLALTHFRNGNSAEARRIGERLIAAPRIGPCSFSNVYRHDHSSAARSNLATVLWIQGQMDRALEMIKGAVDDALTSRNATSICYILSTNACAIALWSGESALARLYIDLLARHADLNALKYMRGIAAGYHRIWTLRTEDGEVLDRRLIPGLDSLPVFDRELMITLEPRLLDEVSASRAAARRTGWCTAEMLRATGEQSLRSSDPSGRITAERLFTEAMASARDQTALSWELRAATSLARSKMATGDGEGALDSLAPVLARFTEGFAMPDVRAATALVTHLRETGGGSRHQPHVCAATPAENYPPGDEKRARNAIDLQIHR